MSALREIIASFGVSVDDKELSKGHDKVESFVGKLREMGEVVVAAFAVEKVKEFVFGLTEEADALKKRSEALGMSVQGLQEWRYAAALSNVSAEALEKTFAKLSGGKFDAKGMAALGVKTKEANGEIRPTEDILEDVADALKGIENPAERNRVAMKVLGKQYITLLPLLKEGGEGIRKMREEFNELGGGFSSEFADQSEEVNDNMTRLGVIWKTLQISILSRVLPALLSLSKVFIEYSKIIVPAIKNSSGLQVAMGLLAVKGIMVLSDKIGPLDKALKMLTKRVLPLVVAFLLLEDVVTFLRGGDSLTGRFLDNAFGDGTAEKVRKWCKEVLGATTELFDEIKHHPERLLDDWNVFTSQLSKDMVSLFGPTFGGILNTAGGMFVTFLDMLTGGTENFHKKDKALWQGYVVSLEILWFEFTVTFRRLFAMAVDGIALGFNKLVDIMKLPLVAAKALFTATGQGQLAQNAQNALDQFDQQKLATDMLALMKAQDQIQRADFVNRFDNAGAVLSPPVGDVNVNVTVPPGTPAETAQRVGNAAADGTKRALENRRTQAVVQPGGVKK